MEQKKQCKAICRFGKRCKHGVAIGDYCLVHFNMFGGDEDGD